MGPQEIPAAISGKQAEDPSAVGQDEDFTPVLILAELDGHAGALQTVDQCLFMCRIPGDIPDGAG